MFQNHISYQNKSASISEEEHVLQGKAPSQASTCNRKKGGLFSSFKFKTSYKSKVTSPAVLLGLGYIQFQQRYTRRMSHYNGTSLDLTR